MFVNPLKTNKFTHYSKENWKCLMSFIFNYTELNNNDYIST